MEFLLTKIKENLNEQMLLLTISNPRKTEEIKKYNIRPVLVKDKLMFQSAAYTKTQVFHKNSIYHSHISLPDGCSSL